MFLYIMIYVYLFQHVSYETYYVYGATFETYGGIPLPKT